MVHILKEKTWICIQRMDDLSRFQVIRYTADLERLLVGLKMRRCLAQMVDMLELLLAADLCTDLRTALPFSSPFTAANHAGSARANRAGSAIWGDEPDIPD